MIIFRDVSKDGKAETKDHPSPHHSSNRWTFTCPGNKEEPSIEKEMIAPTWTKRR